MLTHRNVVAQLNQIDAIESVEMPALLGVLPFFHIYGMVIILMHGLMRAVDHRHDAEVRVRAVPQSAAGLADHQRAHRPADRRRARQAPGGRQLQVPAPEVPLLGSGAAGPELTEAVEKRLNVKIRQGYGMTEASPATHYTVAGTERAGTVGRLMPSLELRIIDPETGKDVPTGQPGEVWVRGPNVMKGYLNNPEATARTVDADGWLHTGDIGVLDADGYLTVVDRLKELIKVKGFQVAPAELESLLLKHPQIADVAVIPVADENCGEVPKAIVVKREPLTAEEVIAFLQPKVAHYKRVKHVAFVDAIPKSPSGKILQASAGREENDWPRSQRASLRLDFGGCLLIPQHHRRLHAHGAPRRHRARQQRRRPISRTTPVNVTGSAAPTPNNRLAISRVAAHRDRDARITPISTTVMPWPTTSLATSPRLPPSAIRMLISFSCCCT